MTGKAHHPYTSQPSCFLPQPASSMSSSLSISSFDHQPQSPMPSSRHDHPPFSTNEHTNTHCLSQPTNCFTQNQHKVLSSIYIIELNSTHCSHHGSCRPLKKCIEVKWKENFIIHIMIHVVCGKKATSNSVLFITQIHVNDIIVKYNTSEKTNSLNALNAKLH